MAFKRCPGSGAFMQPKIEIIACPKCGGNVEIWSDEADGTCPACGKTTTRTTSQSCLDWCQYAQECLGDAKYKKYRELKIRMRKEALLAAVEEYFGNDAKRKARARRRMSLAEDILRGEKRADPNIVIAAAVLHDIVNPEEPSGTNTSEHGGEDRLETAKKILERLDYPPDFTREVCHILARGRRSGQEESLNSRIVHEADRLADGEDS